MSGRNRPRFRRRFLTLVVPGLGVLLAAMGFSFLGSTGSSTPTVSTGSTSSNFVYPVAASATLPCATTSLKYTSSISAGTGTNCATTSTTVTTAVSPSWTPIAQSAGTVTTAGDLAAIDASSANLGTDAGLTVSLYVTNLASLQLDYSSLALPVNVYQSQCSSGCTWTQATGVSTTYLTSTSGFLTWNLPANYYYDVTVETGGSFFCTATTSADLSPSYYFTAQPY